MAKVIEMDEKVTLGSQLQQDVGAVVLINTYTVNPEDEDQFLKTSASVVEISKLVSGGAISSQLHKGIAGSHVFMSYHVFESTEAIKQLYNSPDFQSKVSEYPASTIVSLHVFKKVAVSGICVD